jgi:hypothetical protein
MPQDDEQVEIEERAVRPATASVLQQWSQLMLAALTSIVVTAVGLLIYHWSGPAPIKLATINIGEVMQIKELQLTNRAAGAGVTDRERAQVFEEISQFPVQIEQALAAMQSECKCVLIVRAAIVSGVNQDLTENLKGRLGMAGLTAVGLADALKAANRQAPVPEGGRGDAGKGGQR